MALLFCSACGSKHDYTVSKPNFCGQCGGKLASLANAGLKRKTVEVEEEDEEEDEETPSSNIPHIEKMSFSIEGGIQKVTAGDLLVNPINPDHLKPGVTVKVDKSVDPIRESMDACKSVHQTRKVIDVK